jgi:hypothetical protein
MLVFVALEENDARSALELLARYYKRRADALGETMIYVGHLNDDGEFELTGEALGREVRGPRESDATALGS